MQNLSFLKALIDISAQCFQKITHNCTSNGLTDYSWWVDRFGNKVTYWNGAKSATSQGCRCGDLGLCDTGPGEEGTLCNCDARASANVDHGTLRSLDQLPVMELAYGDSQDRYSWIQYTLDRFTCQGKRSIYPSEIHNNDFSLKVGWSGRDYLSGSYPLAFGETIYDRSFGSWDKTTFTAPVDGFYSFHLNLHYHGSEENGSEYFKIVLYKVTEDDTFKGKKIYLISETSRALQLIICQTIDT